MIGTEGNCESGDSVGYYRRKYEQGEDNDKKIICLALRKGKVGLDLLHDLILCEAKVEIFQGTVPLNS